MFSVALPRAGRRCKCGLARVTSNESQYPISPTRSAQCRRIGNSTWRAVSVLDEWVAREARPISLRQLMVFGRSLTESRLLSSANYVRTELPTRIAHRIRDMQQLPYGVVTNSHISDVYDLYHKAFDTFRKIKEVKTLEDNEHLCDIVGKMLKTHLTVIPKLAMGILESSSQLDREALDEFMTTILRSRISRRVIAEQHLALTETFNSPWFSPGAKLSETEFIGEIFIKCVAQDVISRCASAVQKLARSTYGPDVHIPEIKIDGHLDASFPFILSHIEYIIGELLRNSVQAVIERQQHQRLDNRSSADKRSTSTDNNGAARPPPLPDGPPPPIEVTICEAQQHVIIRISDQGGGIPTDELPHLWSFSGSGPQSYRRLENLRRVPKLAATMQELHVSDELGRADLKTPSSYGSVLGFSTGSSPSSDPGSGSSHGHDHSHGHGGGFGGSLTPLTSRPPDLRLGIGLPLSKVYAEYWAGSLELHSLWGYGVDAFLQISKLGNKNERLTTRASMDAV